MYPGEMKIETAELQLNREPEKNSGEESNDKAVLRCHEQDESYAEDELGFIESTSQDCPGAECVSSGREQTRT